MAKGKSIRKLVKYLLIIAVIGIVVYNSVYIKKLSEVKNQTISNFDPVRFSKKLWDEQLPARLDSVITLSEWVRAIKLDSLQGSTKVSNAIAIGNYRYSLVKIKGIATDIREDDFMLSVDNSSDSTLQITVATEFIYGNAIRDASGLVDIKDFTNTKDLNRISEELNKQVRTNVLPSFKKELKPGSLLEIIGAIEYNKEHIRVNELELIPVRVKILN